MDQILSNNKQEFKESMDKRSLDKLEQIKCLIQILEADLDACDFKWTLFVTAANSNKYDSLLKPFPTEFVLNKDLDIDSLRVKIATIPTFYNLLTILRNIIDDKNQIEHSVDDKAISLMYWCLINIKMPILKSIDRTNFDQILNKVVTVGPGLKPTHIFEVLSQLDSIAEEKFRGYQQHFRTTFAYHGSKLESFYSILNYGLQQHLCKTAAYGEGIYLSSERHISLMYSPTSNGWLNSRFGKRCACLAICEFINHPIHLKCHTNEKTNRTKVPDKFFVITNNEIVRVRYLLVYGTKLKQSNGTILAPYMNWISRHKWLTAIIFYAIILLIIGFSDSRHGYKMRQFMRQATVNAINYIKTVDFLGIQLFQKLFN